MRALLLIAAISLQSAAIPAFAGDTTSQIAATDLSAQTKKPVKKAKKIKTKVEYMRAVPAQ